jgi:hypothetical protein
MPRLSKPSVRGPEYVITMEETLEFAERVYGGKPSLPLALRLIRNTGVAKRHIVRPIEETLHHPGFEERNRVYELESKKRCPEVIEQALANAEVTAHDIATEPRGALQDHIKLPGGPAGAQSLEEGQRLAPSLAFADPVEQLASGQVESGEHVHHAVEAGCRWPAAWPDGRRDAMPCPCGHQVERPELIGADHPAIGGWVIV